jgi:hypothetical protein
MVVEIRPRHTAQWPPVQGNLATFPCETRQLGKASSRAVKCRSDDGSDTMR